MKSGVVRMLEREVGILKSTISQTKKQYVIISREKNAILKKIQNISKKLTRVEVNNITVADHKNRFQDTANEEDEKSTQEISFIIEKIEKEFDQRTTKCKYLEDQFEKEKKKNSNLDNIEGEYELTYDKRDDLQKLFETTLAQYKTLEDSYKRSQERENKPQTEMLTVHQKVNILEDELNATRSSALEKANKVVEDKKNELIEELMNTQERIALETVENKNKYLAEELDATKKLLVETKEAHRISEQSEEELNSINSINIRVQRLETLLTQAQKEKQYVESQLEEARLRTQDDREEMMNLQKQILELLRKCDSYFKEVSHRSSIIDDLRSRMTTLEREVTSFTRDLHTKHHDIGAVESEKMAIKDELENLREKYHQLEEEHLALQEEKENIHQDMIASRLSVFRLKGNYEGGLGDNEKLRRELAAFHKKIAELTTSCETYKEERDRYRGEFGKFKDQYNTTKVPAPEKSKELPKAWETVVERCVGKVSVEEAIYLFEAKRDTTQAYLDEYIISFISDTPSPVITQTDISYQSQNLPDTNEVGIRGCLTTRHLTLYFIGSLTNYLPRNPTTLSMISDT